MNALMANTHIEKCYSACLCACFLCNWSHDTSIIDCRFFRCSVLHFRSQWIVLLFFITAMVCHGWLFLSALLLSSIIPCSLMNLIDVSKKINGFMIAIVVDTKMMYIWVCVCMCFGTMVSSIIILLYCNNYFSKNVW